MECALVVIVREVVFQDLADRWWRLPIGSRVVCNLDTHVIKLPNMPYVQIELDDYRRVLHTKSMVGKDPTKLFALIKGGKLDECEETGSKQSADAQGLKPDGGTGPKNVEGTRAGHSGTSSHH